LAGQVQLVKDLRSTRIDAKTQLESYTSWESIFTNLLNDSTPYIHDDMTLRNRYFVNGAIVLDKFYPLTVGASGKTITMPLTDNTDVTLNGIINYYKDIGIPNIVREIGRRLKLVIDQVVTNYNSDATLFSTEFATRKVIAAPSVFANTQAIVSRTNSDKAKVDAQMPSNTDTPISTELVKIYVAYAGSDVVTENQRTVAAILDYVTGLQSEFSTLKGAATTIKANREEARDEIRTYYQNLLPFVGSGEVLTDVNNSRKTEIENYFIFNINSNKDLEIRVKDSFYDLSNATLDLIESTYKRLNDLSGVYGDYTLAAPEPSVVSLLNVTRYYIINYIDSVEKKYNDYQRFFYDDKGNFFPGITLEDDLQQPAFSNKAASDKNLAKTSNTRELKELQTTYMGLRQRIIEKGGDFGKTFDLRPKTKSAHSTYESLYNEYDFRIIDPKTDVYKNMNGDYTDLLSEKVTTASSVDNLYLDCQRKKYINPFGTDLSGVEDVNCNNSTINTEFNTKQNAYYRLLLACKEVVKANINVVVKYYDDNNDAIELDGKKKLPLNVYNIKYPIENSSPAETMPERDISRMDTIALTKPNELQDLLVSLRNKYYVGRDNIFLQVQAAKNGGSTKGTARTNLNTAMSNLRTQHDIFGKLFTYSDSKYARFLSKSNNATKYLTLLGPGTEGKTDPNVYMYSRIDNTNKFMALDVSGSPNLYTETAAFDNMLTLNNDNTYFSCICEALKQVCRDYKQLWTDQIGPNGLFAFHVANRTNWSPNSLFNPFLATTNGIGFADSHIATLEGYASKTPLPTLSLTTSSEVKDIMDSYLFSINGIAGYFSLLNDEITTAELEKNKFTCKNAIIALNGVYTTYQSLGIDMPTSLTNALKSYTVSSSTFVKDISNATLIKLENDLSGSTAGLLISVRTKLAQVIRSYQSLRNSFLEFYDENKTTLGQIAYFDTMVQNKGSLDGIDNGHVTKLENTKTETVPMSNDEIKVIYDVYLTIESGQTKSPFQRLVDFVQDYFTNPTGAIQSYQGSYDTLFANPSFTYKAKGRQLVAAAPYAFGAPTLQRDLALARAPSPDLLNLVKSYNDRYDYIRDTTARNNVAKAIADYWTLLATVPSDIQMAEIFKERYTNSTKYINLEDTSSPNYPFTSMFMGLKSADYINALKTYRDAKLELLAFVSKKYQDDVTKFVSVYDKWRSFYDGNVGVFTIPKLHTDEIEGLYAYILSTNSNIVTVAEKLRDSTQSFTIRGQSISSDDMYKRMNDFIEKAELYFLTDQYKTCLNTQIGEQTVRVQNNQGVLPNLFGGTSRWSFF
jgi:hypothetical protein